MSSFCELQACCTPGEDAAALFDLTWRLWGNSHHAFAADPVSGKVELQAAKHVAEFLLVQPLCEGFVAKQQGKVRTVLTTIEAMLVAAEPEPEPAPVPKGKAKAKKGRR